MKDIFSFERCVWIFLFLCILPYSGIAQDKVVELLEVKENKRVLFYAKNNSPNVQEVFFKIDGVGFRKSSYRPVIKKVQANSKVLIATAIALESTIPEYTYFFSHDEQLTAINVKGKSVTNWKSLDDALNRGETIVFTKDDCKKCEKLIVMLKASKISYKELNISKYERFESFFWKTVSKYKQKEVYISSIPIVISKQQFYQNVQLIPFVESLKE